MHHLYGATIYGTPWRAHIVHPAMAAMLFILGMLYVSTRCAGTRMGRIAQWVTVGTIVLIPIAWIGLFEGGYNHVVKDLLYFSGTPMSIMQALFPPPIYEMPDDWFFELTGVLQFFVALHTAHCTIQIVRRWFMPDRSFPKLPTMVE